MGFIQDYFTFVGVMLVLAFCHYVLFRARHDIDKYGNVKMAQAKPPENVKIVEKIK